MKIASLEKLLLHPAPAFACYACGDKSKTEALIAPVRHLVNPPAGVRSLKNVPAVPGWERARDFYSVYDGALLFTAEGMMAQYSGDDTSEGIEIFPLAEWPSRTAQTIDSWEEGGYDDAAMPYGRNDFVAFAHFRGASNYIHWVIRGPAAGKIYWWAWTMPPEIGAEPVANNFVGFIDLICTEPVRALNEISLCYTRYSDGVTNTQWIPKRYIADSRNSK
jgi:hypothetical protein